MIGGSWRAGLVRSRLARLAVGAALTAAVGTASPSARAADLVIPAGHEAEIAALTAPYRLGGEVAEGFRLDGIQIGQRRIDFVLATKTATPERVAVVLTLRSSAGILFGTGSAYELSVDPPDERQSASARRVVAALKKVVAHNADEAFWRRVLSAPGMGGRLGLPRVAPAALIGLAALLVVVGAAVMRSRAATRMVAHLWARWAGPTAVVATAVAVPAAAWLLMRSTFGGVGDPDALSQYRHGLQRELAGWSLWIAATTCEAAAILTIVRAGTTRARGLLTTTAALVVDLVAVMAWSSVVRFVLTQPNILTDGGSGYGRLWRQSVPG